MHTALTNYVRDFLVLFAQFIGLDEMPGLAEFLLGHVAALVGCVLIGGEYISLIKSCHIRRRNECVRVKRH